MAKKAVPINSAGERKAIPAAAVVLSGHVLAVTGYATERYTGCSATVHLVSKGLVDFSVGSEIIYTSDVLIERLLEAALSSGNAIRFRGTRTTFPPFPTEWLPVPPGDIPIPQTIYSVDIVTLTNAK
jgi:hypothetical protein